MRKIQALVFLAAVATLSTLAQATDVTLGWTAPAANTDGSSPPVLSGYNIYMASTDAALSALPLQVNGGKPNVTVSNVLTYVYKSVAPGTYFYAITAWFCPGSTGAGCVESVQSPHVSITVAPPVVVPGSPTNVKISATLSAPQ